MESLNVSQKLKVLLSCHPYHLHESFAKWQKNNNVVIPAKAGIQCFK